MDKGQVKILIVLLAIVVIVGIVVIVLFLNQKLTITPYVIKESDAESSNINSISEPENKEENIVKKDSDGDGLDDEVEVRIGSNPKAADSDSDGLNDKREYELGTSLTSSDTDNDGLEDGKEVNLGSDPKDTDTDNDGLDDKQEFYNTGTNLLSYDTDGDGLGDGSEVNTYETDPKDSDTDNDGLNDGQEISKSCDPKKQDTDGDGYYDYSDLFCRNDASIQLKFNYLIMDEGFDSLGDDADPYIKVSVYKDGNWESFSSSSFDGQREVNNPYSTNLINVPDNQKDISIKVEVWDYDTWDSPDEADINPDARFGEYSFVYDITSKYLSIELDGNKDGLNEGDAVLRFGIFTY